MRNTVLCITISLTALLLGAKARDAGAGFRIVWEREMATPEAQKALHDYIEQYCVAEVWKYDADRLVAGTDTFTQLHLRCRTPQKEGR